ncbi:MAG TPA: glycosyltransferase [Bacteroidales bacterium]|jgi:hypothetical protein|nr:glycosyltransferase [Bacteroidales bacterium]HOU98609.1 glycosyltransferase [Bacteroidales bacterium]
MTISGFTMVRNATKLYFPIKESISSILPMVDEFIVALGKGDEDDTTEQEIQSLQSDKIKIIHREWDSTLYKNGKIFAHETNIALKECKGDWCFYLQADEVIHENDLPILKKACAHFLEHKNVDGFTLKYHHFFGDYQHYLPIHGWCRSEIRIVRNNIGVYSYNDANTFRKGNNEKLNIIALDAYVYHYGWVRPPFLMQKKKNVQDSIHAGQHEVVEKEEVFSYGNLSKVPIFHGSHPNVMQERIANLSWSKELSFNEVKLMRPKMKHEKVKYKVLSFFENKLLGGKQLFGYKNWNKLGKYVAQRE